MLIWGWYNFITNMPNSRYHIFTISTVLFILLLSFGVYTFSLRRSNQSLQNKLNQTLGNETTFLVETVGKLIKLPEGETPNIATVMDKAQLQNQEFFKNAENGDKILVYKNAKKAFLYRPSENRIIEVGPVKEEITPAPFVTTTQSSSTPSGRIIFRAITVSPTPTGISPSPTIP